jgi:hypothetical protein
MGRGYEFDRALELHKLSEHLVERFAG